MTTPRPLEPDSREEWELELAAFAAANDPQLPQAIRELIQRLWAEVVAREQWRGKPKTVAQLEADWAKRLPLPVDWSKVRAIGERLNPDAYFDMKRIEHDQNDGN